MKIPFFNYSKLYLKDKEIIDQAYQSVMARGAFILQEDLKEFEHALAVYTGAKYCIGVANGTDAIWLSMMACGLKPGDEVLIPSHTYIATVGAAKFLGIDPILVECGGDHLIDINQLNDKVTSKTKAIMPVHLNGRTANMDQVSDFAIENGLLIIEDAAQGIGSKFKRQMAGTFGLTGTYSFYPAKTLGCFGDGGAILTNDDQIYETLYELRDHGRGKNGEYNQWGVNSRLDNLQAAILLAKLKNLDKEIVRRREIAYRYTKAFLSIEMIITPPGPDENADHFDTYQNYEIECEQREKLMAFLYEKNIGTIIQWGGKAIHQIEALNFNSELPYTNEIFKKCLLLPMNTTLTDEAVEYIISVIQEFYIQS